MNEEEKAASFYTKYVEQAEAMGVSFINRFGQCIDQKIWKQTLWSVCTEELNPV